MWPSIFTCELKFDHVIYKHSYVILHAMFTIFNMWKQKENVKYELGIFSQVIFFSHIS